LGHLTTECPGPAAAHDLWIDKKAYLGSKKCTD